MRRNIELIRKLLLRLESLPINNGEGYSLSPQDKEIAIEGYSLDETYHLSLLREMGFADCPGSQPLMGITFLGLTWSGHDYLDAVRNPEMWRKTKEGAEAAGGPGLTRHHRCQPR
jgi:hypothetical protein